MCLHQTCSAKQKIIRAKYCLHTGNCSEERLSCHDVMMDSTFNVIQTDWKCLPRPYKSQISSRNPGKFISVISSFNDTIYFQSKRERGCHTDYNSVMNLHRINMWSLKELTSGLLLITHYYYYYNQNKHLQTFKYIRRFWYAVLWISVRQLLTSTYHHAKYL